MEKLINMLKNQNYKDIKDRLIKTSQVARTYKQVARELMTKGLCLK